MTNVERFVSPQTGENNLIYRVPEGRERKGCILAFHGGCFVGGSTEYDAKQNNALAERGFEVHQVSFPKTSWTDFVKWATGEEMVEFFAQQNETFGGAVYVLGRSSGGLLAKFVFEHFHKFIAKAIYLCPVFQPIERAKLVPDTRALTAQFFCTDAETGDFSFGRKFCLQREMIVAAFNDDRVPHSCFTQEQQLALRFLRPTTHSRVCTCNERAFIDELEQFLQ